MRLGSISQWGARVLIVPAGMVVALLFVPVPTSLGDGTAENVLTGWQGIYDQMSHQYSCRFLLQGGGYHDVLSTSFPQSWLVSRRGEFLVTRSDLPGIMSHAAVRHPREVEQNLGTFNNVSAVLRPFPGEPVAFSAALLQSLARQHWNPRSVGGPNIPPTSDAETILQIDTRVDNDRLVQLSPGAMPRPLRALIRHRQHRAP